ncbi:MAG TPA: hypothetical protein VHW65_06595 [Gemmatimonadales bacterium]|jgi:hypothetical protein|nr:hypothetical protein [Gemmatimonadales bacterium]
MSASFAADLGRLAAPAPAAPWDDVRLALVDAILAGKVAGHLDQAVWQQAFDAAARSLRVRILGDAESAIREAAAVSHYPRRRLAAVLPDDQAADAVLQRLLAAGMPLERLEGVPDDPASRRARAAALESAWEDATIVARAEVRRQNVIAARVAAWQRPVRLLWGASAVVLVFALLVAAWLGGQLAVPAWFRPLSDAWWSLPWP